MYKDKESLMKKLLKILGELPERNRKRKEVVCLEGILEETNKKENDFLDSGRD